MKHPKLVSLLVMITVFSSVAGICWALSATHESNAQPDNPMPKLMIHEQIRDATIEYIRNNHPEVEQFMADFAWTGGRVTPEGLLGAETYTYQSSGWTVTIHYPVIANPTYNITVDYSTTSIGPSIPYSVTWQGTFENGCVTEASYVFAQ